MQVVSLPLLEMVEIGATMGAKLKKTKQENPIMIFHSFILVSHHGIKRTKQTSICYI
jgi:hypothetical protein